TRKPKKLPVMNINGDIGDLFGFSYEDFSLEGYDPEPGIKARVSV
ncbi:MAG: thymidylate synthase, partial [Hyphomicrobiales bacterium]|nr:thymidylate synthase [Hyphomicrobiales bacterium]